MILDKKKERKEKGKVLSLYVYAYCNKKEKTCLYHVNQLRISCISTDPFKYCKRLLKEGELHESESEHKVKILAALGGGRARLIAYVVDGIASRLVGLL